MFDAVQRFQVKPIFDIGEFGGIERCRYAAEKRLCSPTMVGCCAGVAEGEEELVHAYQALGACDGVLTDVDMEVSPVYLEYLVRRMEVMKETDCVPYMGAPLLTK